MSASADILARLDAIGRQPLAELDLDACRALHEDLMRLPGTSGGDERLAVDVARALLRMAIAVQWSRHATQSYRQEAV